MKSFSEYFQVFLENSSPLNSVKPSDIGLSNSVQNLPDVMPYGFWIDRHGNFIAVRNQGHSDTAIGIFNKIRKLTGETVPESSYPYKVMFTAGWVRVVTYYGELLYEMGSGQTPSSYQIRLMKFMQDLYDLKEIRKS